MPAPQTEVHASVAPNTRPQLARALCVIVAVALLVDAVFVMAHRVFSFGVTLPLAISCALLFLAWRWDVIHAWVEVDRARRKLWRLLWGLFWLWVLTVAGFWVVLARQGHEGQGTGARAPAAIVVLGSGTPGGKVSPVLAARLETAYLRAQACQDAVVVVSGGMDFAETRSEGEIMGDYLRAKGLAASRIAQEERSTSTEQNLLFSRAVLQHRGIAVERTQIEIVTSDFHTLRARWIASRAGYAHVRAVGAPTPLYVRYNAWLREYFAALSGFVLREF